MPNRIAIKTKALYSSTNFCNNFPISPLLFWAKDDLEIVISHVLTHPIRAKFTIRSIREIKEKEKEKGFSKARILARTRHLFKEDVERKKTRRTCNVNALETLDLWNPVSPRDSISFHRVLSSFGDKSVAEWFPKLADEISFGYRVSTITPPTIL